jgi:hypothetical protein
LAFALHAPLQLAAHLLSQLASGNSTSHEPSQWAEQLALQEAEHEVLSSEASHLAWHWPEQSARQVAAQSNFPGSTVQSGKQSFKQPVSHPASADAVHSPSQSTVS